MSKSICIIGGGIAGLCTALALKNKGIEVSVFEASSEIKALGAGLGMAANAIKAFDKLGIKAEVIEAGRVLDTFQIRDDKGKTISTINSKAISQKYGTDNFTIHRGRLHSLLLSKIAQEQIHTSKRAISFEKTGQSIMIHFQDGSQHYTDYVIVADGIHSPIRKQLIPNSQIRYAGYTCWRAVVDNGPLALTETSETWGPNGRIGIVPLADNKTYWFACLSAKANDPDMKALKVHDLWENFKDYHEPIPSILKQTKDEHLLLNDIIDLKPIKQYAFDNIVLIGDAAHATTPNMGQGACQAVEDAVVLAEELAQNEDWTLAFKKYEKRRLKRTHFIVNNSWNLGKIAQTENKALIKIRNLLLRMTPASVNEMQFSKLYKVDFE